MEEKKITVKTVVGIVIFVALLAVLVMVVMRGVAANKALEETAESPTVTVQPTPTPTPEPTPTPVACQTSSRIPLTEQSLKDSFPARRSWLTARSSRSTKAITR